MNKYTVLWFDDEHAELEMIKEEALLCDIELIGVNNATDGLAELATNFLKYDAVLLDGLFFNEASQTGDAVDETAFGMVAKQLIKLKAKGTIIPWFILSGQPSFVREKNKIVTILADGDYGDGRVFDKNRDEDFQELFTEIKKASIEIESTRVKNKYSKAFVVFERGILNRTYQCILIDMLKCIEKNDYKKKNMNTVRDLLEAIFLTLADDFECIPDSFINENNNPNLKLCTLFFAGKDVKDYNGDTYKIPFRVPGHISWSISYIKELSSQFSHVSENGIIKNPFISSSFAILEVLEWLPDFIEENYE